MSTLYVPQIRLFLSSPGDVYEERAIVHEEIEALVNLPSFREKISFRVIAWDKKGAGTVMRFRMPPQEAINIGLPRPAECDIVIVIFWSRLGTAFTTGEGETFQSGTHYELKNAVDSSRPEVVIYKGNHKPHFDPDAPDLKEKTEQYENLKTFLANDKIFYDPKTGVRRGIGFYENPEAFRIMVRNDLHQLALDFLEKIKTVAEPSVSPPPVAQAIEIKSTRWVGSPFPGLRSFQYADAPIFFGRGREANAVVERLKHNRFVGVVGASGSGKSSLVMAGVLPRLLERNAIYSNQTASEYWRVVQFTPSSHQKIIYQSPFESLYYALLEVFPQLVDNPLRAQRIKREFLADIVEEPATLVESCKYLLSEAPRGSEVLLFIDQFEELFTLIGESDRLPFVKMLKAASESEQLRVIITMRSDFYQHCVDLPMLAELLQKGSFPLSTPTGGALYEMVRYPADRAALEFEEGLEQTILKETGEGAGALALLAYALDELYKIAEKRGDRRLTDADYTALGGVHGAIGQRAEAVFGELEGEEAEKQSSLKTIFHALVAVNEEGTPTRQRVPYSVEESEPAIEAMVAALTKARLLTQDATANHRSTLEVAHEALFRSWGRLKGWIEEAQEDLILLRQMTNGAKEWEKRGRPDFLRWNQERLVLVYAMLERLKSSLNEMEQAFIEPEQERLYREIEEIETTHERRRSIGDRLAEIGDTRQGVGVKEGIPEIAWLAVKGSGGEKVECITDDDSIGKFAIADFFIGKYLITYAQYQAFVEAKDGYDNKEWWRDFPAEYQPQKLNGARAKMANAPRDSVSWYQAVAFTRWLDAQLRERGMLPDSKMEVSLLTEWEWQWVSANGLEKRAHAWGDWDRYPRANINDAGLSRSTAVGMYPHGKAACGALDMSGNLWEWCLNNYSKPEIMNGYKDRESKVLRGGSFSYDQNYARSVSRNLNDPLSDHYDLGFRVCCCPHLLRL